MRFSAARNLGVSPSLVLLGRVFVHFIVDACRRRRSRT